MMFTPLEIIIKKKQTNLNYKEHVELAFSNQVSNCHAFNDKSKQSWILSKAVGYAHKSQKVSVI